MYVHVPIHIFKLLVKSGARVNIIDRRRSLNALMRLALSNLDRLGDDEGILLYAAGERVKVPLLQRYVAETIDLPDYMKPTLCLKHLCRRAITNHLLSIDEHNHLFGRYLDWDCRIPWRVTYCLTCHWANGFVSKKVLGCSRFAKILQNCVVRQVFGRMCSVVFLAFT